MGKTFLEEFFNEIIIESFKTYDISNVLDDIKNSDKEIIDINNNNLNDISNNNISDINE